MNLQIFRLKTFSFGNVNFLKNERKEGSSKLIILKLKSSLGKNLSLTG